MQHAVDRLVAALESTGQWSPWLFLALFLLGSFLMIWRLEAMAAGGLEGTVLGTLVMPYCTGLGNLIFAYVLGKRGGDPAQLVSNCFVNNVTNMTLLIGLPAVFWGLDIVPARAEKSGDGGRPAKQSSAQSLNRLSLLLTLTAVLFFTGAVWAVGRKGKLSFDDGLVLVGLFFFWQCFHLFEVLKTNARQNRSLGWMLPVDIALLAVGAYTVYVSTDWLVGWVGKIPAGFVSARHLGWLSGWLMVLPNGLLAFYYAWKKQPEVVYTSQVGDGHICIPFCLGVFALFRPFVMPPSFTLGAEILVAATAVHFWCVALFGRLPRFFALLLVAGYGYFCWRGFN